MYCLNPGTGLKVLLALPYPSEMLAPVWSCSTMPHQSFWKSMRYGPNAVTCCPHFPARQPRTVSFAMFVSSFFSRAKAGQQCMMNDSIRCLPWGPGSRVNILAWRCMTLCSSCVFAAWHWEASTIICLGAQGFPSNVPQMTKPEIFCNIFRYL
jgi:hypothetical protein